MNWRNIFLINKKLFSEKYFNKIQIIFIIITFIQSFTIDKPKWENLKYKNLREKQLTQSQKPNFNNIKAALIQWKDHHCDKTKLVQLSSSSNSLSCSESQMATRVKLTKTYLKKLDGEIRHNKELPYILPEDFQDDENEEEIQTDKESTPLRLTKENIGRFTWRVLHTMASAFPINPDNKAKIAMKNFIEDM